MSLADAAAWALVSTAARRPDRRAEKIVSRRYRFLWICNPKAASRSLIAALRAADPEAVLIRHRTLEQVLARYPEAGAFFRFAFLRHPYHRTAWAPGAKVQAKKVTGPLPRLAD